MERSIRVVCADDCADMLLLLRLLLGEMPGVEHVGEALQARRVPPLTRESQADVVIMDLRMPGEDPLDVVRELASDQPNVKVLVYSGMEQPEAVQRALTAGAKGFVTKDAAPDVIRRAVERVAAGETFVSVR